MSHDTDAATSTAASVPSVKVLHVLEALRGGTSRHVVDLVRAAPDVSHHVAVPVDQAAAASGAVLDRAALADLAQAGAVVHPLDMRRKPLHPSNLVAMCKLRRLIREIRPDVVHGHSSVGGALARVSALGTPSTAFYTPNGLAPGRASRLIERLLGRITEVFVAVSASEAERAIGWRLVERERVAVVPNGIDTAVTDAPAPDIRELAGVPDGAPVVGTVIRLVAQKAPDLFVAVCALVANARDDVHFVIIGLGPMQEMVDQQVAAAGLGDRWHQIPHLPEAAAVLGQLDVFVLLSAFEGGPYTPLEAMRAGVPVVLTDVVGNHDVVEPGVSGLLAPFGDVPALAEAVLGLLEDRDCATRMADAGRRRVDEVFDVKVMGDSMTGLYRRTATSPVPLA